MESISPCTRVKHLANLLRNKVNSQQYPRVYEDKRPKSIENTEQAEGKGIASGQKGPWDQLRDRLGVGAAAAPGRAPAVRTAGLLGESRVNGSLPYQTRPEQHHERPGCLKSQGGE